MDGNLFIEMVHVAIIGSIISSQAIQKIKHIIKLSKRFNKFISIVISFVIGYTYAFCFYSSNRVYDIWIGIFTLIGAEGMYRSFKGSFGLESVNGESNTIKK